MHCYSAYLQDPSKLQLYPVAMRCHERQARWKAHHCRKSSEIEQVHNICTEVSYLLNQSHISWHVIAISQMYASIQRW